MKKILIPSLTLSLSFVLMNCGGDDAKPTKKAASPKLEGQYAMSSVTCTEGELTSEAKTQFEKLPYTLSIAGTTVTIVHSITASCSRTQNYNISDVTDSNLTTTEGSKTCSDSCLSNECKPAEATGDSYSQVYSLSGNTLSLTEPTHDSDTCEKPAGLVKSSWTKK